MREILGRLLLLIGAPLLLWGLVEGAATLAGVEPLGASPDYVSLADHRACQFGWREAEWRCNPADVDTRGRKLLVTLGGSSVFGFPLRKGLPLARPLRYLLQEAEPEGWKVASRGFPCKDTSFVRQCACELFEAEPSVLVIYAGHNDFANWWPQRTRLRIWLEENAWIYDVERWLAGSRGYTLLARAFSLGIGGGTSIPDPELALAARRQVLEKFSDNISQVIERAGRQGARVMLVTVASNLYEFPVRRADWETGPEQLVSQRRSLAGWAEHFERGVALQRQGRHSEALTAFKQARDADPQGRAPSALNERIREIAARYPNAHLVDFELQLEREAGSEGIGCNFFGTAEYCDQFHPNARAQRLIGRAVFEEMRRLGLVP